VYAEASVLREASLYLWVAAWSQTATAADSVLQQALAGAGRTFAMALTTTFGLVLRVPLAYLLAHSLDWGSEGIWWAFNLSNWLKLAAIVWAFRRTRLLNLSTPRSEPVSLPTAACWVQISRTAPPAPPALADARFPRED
jgi:Na+-driven multidrug efflux pump